MEGPRWLSLHACWLSCHVGPSRCAHLRRKAGPALELVLSAVLLFKNAGSRSVKNRDSSSVSALTVMASVPIFVTSWIKLNEVFDTGRPICRRCRANASWILLAAAYAPCVANAYTDKAKVIITKKLRDIDRVAACLMMLVTGRRVVTGRLLPGHQGQQLLVVHLHEIRP